MISEIWFGPVQISKEDDIKISVVVPTYNEKENLVKFVHEIGLMLDENILYEIIVVDDNSPDGTGQLADGLSRTNNHVRVIHRPKKLGISSAVIDGFRKSKGEYVVVSDADLQHSPKLFKTFLNEANKGADLVIASRYISGGNTEGWSPWREIVSKGARLLAHFFFPKIRMIRDPLSGYFMVRKSGLVETHLTGLSWKILLEILVNDGFKNVIEVPYSFKPRTNGKSKLKTRDYLDYLTLIYLLQKHRKKS